MKKLKNSDFVLDFYPAQKPKIEKRYLVQYNNGVWDVIMWNPENQYIMDLWNKKIYYPKPLQLEVIHVIYWSDLPEEKLDSLKEYLHG